MNLLKASTLLSVLLMLIARSSSADKVQQNANVMDGAVDGLMLAMKNKLAENLKWSVEETDKAACCSAAFTLCEPLPQGTTPLSKSGVKRALAVARTECSKIGTVKLKTSVQICGFYSNIVNCAYTPNTEQDWQTYMDNLGFCCDSAQQYCATKNDTNLYQAKKDCMGYAKRTDADICDQANSEDCQ